MNRNTNTYTLIFAAIMVLIVTSALTLAHEALKERQNKNIEIDKMSQILRSIKIESTAENAEVKFNEFISDVFLIDANGNRIPNSEEHTFFTEMKTEMTKPEKNRQFPVFVANIEGDKKYILALAGKGLWGDLWGYIAVNSDGNTIYGADFSHASETPGLGAEVSHHPFSDQFENKSLFKDGVFKSIAVVKKGKSTTDSDYVDGLSGGTITGTGVEHMLFNSLSGYGPFLKNLNINK